MKITNSEQKEFEQTELRSIFSDVINGYSTVIDKNRFGVIYIKHLTNSDISDIEIKRIYFKERAKKVGIPTFEERRLQCIEEGSWSEEKDQKILILKERIKSQDKARSLMPLDSNRKILEVQIKKNKEELNQLEFEKFSVVDNNCDTYTDKKINEYYIYTSFFASPKLTKKKFTEEEYEDLDKADLVNLVNLYNDSMVRFETANLKKVALSNNFVNFFYLCKDDPMVFYGRAVAKLSFLQVELFSYGVYFKNAISNSQVKPPEELYDDPDHLMEWLESSNNLKATLEKKALVTHKSKSNSKADTEVVGGGTSIPGANKDEIRRSGAQGEMLSFSEAAKKKGGKLDYEDILSLHGIKIKKK